MGNILQRNQGTVQGGPQPAGMYPPYQQPQTTFRPQQPQFVQQPVQYVRAPVAQQQPVMMAPVQQPQFQPQFQQQQPQFQQQQPQFQQQQPQFQQQQPQFQQQQPQFQQQQPQFQQQQPQFQSQIPQQQFFRPPLSSGVPMQNYPSSTNLLSSSPMGQQSSYENDLILANLTGWQVHDIERLRQEFALYANQFGVIDRVAFQKLYIASLLNMTWTELERDSEAAFRNFDINRTGTLDFNEYITACSRMSRDIHQQSHEQSPPYQY